MTVFNDSLDLRSVLAAAAGRGAAFVPDALTERFRRELQDEANAMTLEPMPAEEGVARQEGEILMINGTDSPYRAIEQLRTALNARVSAHADDIDGLGQWRPNHVSVQRYPPGALGITTHLDQKRYHYLVAVFTAEGCAPFMWCKDRAGTPEAVWQAGPGSLVVLRGPGLAGIEDGRPLHTVTGPPAGRRVSVTFRMDSRAG
jgi:hypothetical protein